jgi:hypothetical protein
VVNVAIPSRTINSTIIRLASTINIFDRLFSFPFVDSSNYISVSLAHYFLDLFSIKHQSIIISFTISGSFPWWFCLVIWRWAGVTCRLRTFLSSHLCITHFFSLSTCIGLCYWRFFLISENVM